MHERKGHILIYWAYTVGRMFLSKTKLIIIKMLLADTNVISWRYITFSRTFEKTGRTEIGL